MHASGILKNRLKRSIYFFPALYVALKDAPDRICDLQDHRPKIVNVIKALLGSDMVPLAQNGVRATGYYFLYLLKQHEELPQELIGPFCRYSDFTKKKI